MVRITRWQDYPEFLERFEEHVDLSDEEVAEMDILDVVDLLEEKGFKGTTLSSAETLRSMAQYNLPEGKDDTRAEYFEEVAHTVWRDLKTGRFVRNPFAE